MSKDGETGKEDLTVQPIREGKTRRNNPTIDTNIEEKLDDDDQHLDLTDEPSWSRDSDSGISSVARARHRTTTDEEPDDELLSRTARSSFAVDGDLLECQSQTSEHSSITNFTINKTTSDFQLSSIKSGSRSASQAPIASMSLSGKSNTQLPQKTFSGIKVASEGKSKGGVRGLLRKMFRPSSNSRGSSVLKGSTPQSPNSEVYIDHQRGYAYGKMSPLPITQGPIRLLVLRHGERLDRYYSSQWLRQAFDKDGNFCRFSPILPETLPFRASIRDFDTDPPLTYKGLKDAYHTGTVLKTKNIQIHHCYSSPSLRCVQTAAKILEGLQLPTKLKIKLEPGLFECTGWYTADETSNVLIMPRFMTKKELLENKYVIDKDYREQMSITAISKIENELEFYERSHATTSAILKMHENDLIAHIQQGQTSPQQPVHILFIAHAPSLETTTRKLCGGRFRPDTLSHVIRNVDFLTMTVIEKTDNNSDKWIFRRSSFYGDEF